MTFPQKNMEGYDYDAAASTIKIDDITSDKCNREILRKLKENDPGYVSLVVSKEGVARGLVVVTSTKSKVLVTWDG